MFRYEITIRVADCDRFVPEDDEVHWALLAELQFAADHELEFGNDQAWTSFGMARDTMARGKLAAYFFDVDARLPLTPPLSAQRAEQTIRAGLETLGYTVVGLFVQVLEGGLPVDLSGTPDILPPVLQ